MTLPKNGCAVESRVFYNTPNLTSMFIPSGMIGHGGFDSPTGLAANYVTNVTLADGITVLGGLGGFERLTSLDIPNTVTEITQYAFDGCSAIERMYVPDTVKSIGSCAFSSMGALKELRLPEGISDVDFVRDCPLLETVNLPTSVNWIGDQAFRDLPCLRSLRVTDSVHSLSDYPQYGNRPFMNCPNLVLELDEGCITQDYAEKYGIPYTIAKPKTDLSQASAWGIANDETVGYDYVFVKMPDGTALDSYWDFTFENETRDGKRGALIKGAHTYMGELWLPVPSAKSPQTITCASIKTLVIGKRASLSAKSSAGTQLVYYSSAPKVLAVDAKGNVTAKAAGKAQITIAAPETTTHKQAVKTITVTVAKKANTLLAKRTKASVACAPTKTKAQIVGTGIRVTKAIGSVSYANASTNKAAKKFKISAKNGKVTVPKGTKKGSYPVKIRVTAGGNASYNKGVKVVSLSIKVK